MNSDTSIQYREEGKIRQEFSTEVTRPIYKWLEEFNLTLNFLTIRGVKWKMKIEKKKQKNYDVKNDVWEKSFSFSFPFHFLFFEGSESLHEEKNVPSKNTKAKEIIIFLLNSVSQP